MAEKVSVSSFWQRYSRIAHRAGAAVNRILGHVGLHVMRAEKVVLDLRDVAQDPIEAAYRAGPHAYLIDIELTRYRILSPNAFPCVVGERNPFIETLQGYARGDVSGYEQSPLFDFHRRWQPASAADALGLDGVGVSEILHQAPPLGFVMPWVALTPSEAIIRWKGIIEADNREHGVKKAASLGWKSWGPVDPAIGALEFKRLISIYESVRSRGYQRSDEPNGDIEGIVLARDGDYRILISPGHHRAAALAALDYGAAPVRLYSGRVVRRSEVLAWPNVRAGLFTPAQALAVFDRVYEARLPASCPWPAGDG